MSTNGSNNAETLSLGTRLALERTRVAYERTRMAWVRTATSMITFGFSVYKFFDLELAKWEGTSAIGPREFGISLILIGLVTLVTGRVEHRRDLRILEKHYPGMPVSGTSVMGVFVTVLGFLALSLVILRI
jgi:inner membrane protein YidH